MTEPTELSERNWQAVRLALTAQSARIDELVESGRLMSQRLNALERRLADSEEASIRRMIAAAGSGPTA